MSRDTVLPLPDEKKYRFKKVFDFKINVWAAVCLIGIFYKVVLVPNLSETFLRMDSFTSYKYEITEKLNALVASQKELKASIEVNNQEINTSVQEILKLLVKR